MDIGSLMGVVEGVGFKRAASKAGLCKGVGSGAGIGGISCIGKL